MTTGVWPLAITNHGSHGMLEIAWSDGLSGIFAHGRLRAACRCAQCSAALRSGTPVRVADSVRLTSVEPYGHNTLHLGFDDGHQRGLYPFEYLRLLAAQPE